MFQIHPKALAIVGFVLLISPRWLPADEVSFNRDIRPLLSNRCFACHGPDAESREAELRLDRPDGDEGAIGFVIKPGSVKDSELWNRVTSDDESVIMPPPDSHVKPLNEKERGLIKRWIESGAKYEGFWAFERPVKPVSPVVRNTSWSKQTIDLLVLRKLETIDRSPASEAELRTLIRRVTFDLTGLPPTRSEIAGFLDEYKSRGEEAWEQFVDRLLARPEYGEHVGRYWLDLVRFADSNGMHKDFYRNQYAYRDWVIRSFNDNLGYDDFLRFQLAGDLYQQPSNDQLIASGFNRLHLIIDKGTALPEESFSKNVIDRVTSVGTAFMGLTVHCAQCHDHKFDPITQQDFYSLSAFFNNIDAAPETVSGRGSRMGFQYPFISLGTPEQQQQLDGLDTAVVEARAKLNARKKLAKGKDADAEKKTAALLKRRQQERDNFDQSIPKAMVMKEREDIRPTFIYERGQYDAPGKQVSRNTPGFLPPLTVSGKVASRMDLAEWFVDPANPLTARVAVNRLWQQCFGVGLVKTSEDFGSQGDVPSHPQLLDYLAVSFVESGWDVKALLKQIVMSKTYRQSSISTPEQFKADAENRLLARGSRYRLDAEVIRDQILATSGLLSRKMYGPSVKPPQPEGLWKAVSMTGERYRADSGEAARRRSVYTFWKRSMPPPQMTILNAPLRDACIARRERTNTPTQALLLLNEPEYLEAARELAVAALKQPVEKRLDFVWETVTAQLPDKNEQAVMQRLLVDMRQKYSANTSLADDLCHGLELPGELFGKLIGNDSTAELKAEIAAWTILCNAVYNLDITKTKD